MSAYKEFSGKTVEEALAYDAWKDLQSYSARQLRRAVKRVA